ncbi:MAG: hypothetical protein WC959_06915 [Kiritimatiellales bacterium]
MKVSPVILISFAAALAGPAAMQSFDRYQIILDKHPFGDMPLEGDLAIVPAEQSFARNMRLSMLFESGDGSVRVGIVDDANKKSYILAVGEPQEGLELIEADIIASEAMLKRGSEVVLFKLEAGTPQQVSKSEQTSRQKSYTERRKALLQRIEEQKKPEEPPQPRLTGEALRKHLENVQMDAIRQGLPPLPIPLTPEMDAQLVSEGVLPPQ